MTAHRAESHRGLVWVAGLVVAAGAGVATAHGLYEVAIATGVPAGMAWLYPLITDGLALVAYAATGRLDRRGRGYAWIVVVLAAGLSGLAQAAYLAGGVTTAPTGLRFGVGAWPAVAATVVAHLVHLLGAASPAPSAGQPVHTEASDVDRLARFSVDTAPDGAGFSGPSEVFKPGGPAADQAAESEAAQAALNSPVQRDEPPAVHPVQPAEHLNPMPAGDRARAAARDHQDRHGRLPSVSELSSLASVARGTASAVLRQLRVERPALQIVPPPRKAPTSDYRQQAESPSEPSPQY